jgi:hypothetical protein
VKRWVAQKTRRRGIEMDMYGKERKLSSKVRIISILEKMEITKMTSRTKRRINVKFILKCF